MQKNLIIKLSIILGLCIIFGVGLTMIQSLVYERQRNADSITEEIANQHVNAQQIITPFIVLSPNAKSCRVTQTNGTTDSKQTNDDNTNTKQTETPSESHCHESRKIKTLIPIKTQSTQNIKVSDDKYKRGIYHATSYESLLTFNQIYQIKGNQDSNLLNKTEADAHQPEVKSSISGTLLIPISDLRGVKKMPTININGKEYQASYPDLSILTGLSYLQIPLDNDILTSNKDLTVEINIPLSGMSEIQTIPLGQQFTLKMNSNWHSPKFIGQALPSPKKFSHTGFEATWENQHIAFNNNKLLSNCINQSQKNCLIGVQRQPLSSYMIEAHNQSKDSNVNKIRLNSFDVQFATPNDVYLQTERSLKYGLLLLAISFGSFFLFEVIKSLRIHPIQYLLVSMALLVFYVLLLSLAEQIAFWKAYTIAGAACAGLIGWYASYVLKSVKRAGIFTMILSAQYAGFYTILTIEELNLLIGAVLCFILIASVMYLTRKIDWYAIR